MPSPLKVYGQICSPTDILVRFWKMSKDRPRKNSSISKISYWSKYAIDEVKTQNKVRKRTAAIYISNLQVKGKKINISIR